MTSSGLQCDPAVPPKATLFCPDCPHRSRYDGDWHVVGDDRYLRYLCPDCRTEITIRPIQQTPRTAASVWQTWQDCLRTWQGFWWQTLTLS